MHGPLGQPLRTLCQRWWVTLHHLSMRRVFTVLAAGMEKGIVLKQELVWGLKATDGPFQ